MEQLVNTYGIFWIPSAFICEQINQIKQSVIQLESEADYVYHPVHSTIFLFNSILQPKEVAILFEKMLKDKSAFEVVIYGWKIFHQDPITRKHTITWGVQLNQSLSNLQKSIAEAIITKEVLPIKYPVSWDGDYALSYKRWGFPFVGSHWIPHITVASVKSDMIVFGVQEKFPLKPQIDVCREIGLFLINGQTHSHLISHQLS